ncbi:hypothetical protein CMEL01_08078 [Colletotrichum melonis]|uniref:Uncharacterized protein n=1 Tax=Colletotrichum melonis TaxID=1209925 RepID=A0AAI9U1R3_9PEZI|nr:hypothetical protein CMEL01_08078 [Colletotrichum melonis]
MGAQLGVDSLKARVEAVKAQGVGSRHGRQSISGDVCNATAFHLPRLPAAAPPSRSRISVTPSSPTSTFAMSKDRRSYTRLAAPHVHDAPLNQGLIWVHAAPQPLTRF